MNHNLSGIKKITKGNIVSDGAGVRIHRVLGTPDLDVVDPFLLLDEFRTDNPDDYIAGFPMHPHRGIETITYMIKGRFKHEDSNGNGGLLSDGEVQWMTAGRGILHSEIPEMKDGRLWGYQLWLNLPAHDKMCEPHYQHLSQKDIPIVKNEGLMVKIISGKFDGVQGPAQNKVKADYFDVTLDKDSFFNYELDKKLNRFLYIHTGSVRVNPSQENTLVESHQLITLDNETHIEIQGESDISGFLFLAGIPNNEPIVKGGPFVMNTEEEIRQAIRDYHSGVLA